jgi:hypothetical protein
MTKILSGDSHKNENKNPKINRGSPRSAARVQQDGDSTGDPRTKLGNCFFYYAMCVFFFYYE